MDEKDIDILRILEENSRLCAEEIAPMVNLDTLEVQERIRASSPRRLSEDTRPQSTGNVQATGRSQQSLN
jgi:hypothetical protein